MSIIERALQKHKHTVTLRQDDEPNRAVELGRAAATAVGSSALPARTFRRVPLDRNVLEANRVLTGIKDASAMAAYKMLRTRVLQRVIANSWRSFGVTGIVSGEGKSLTAINLALALARDVSTHVFLVDVDLQRSSVARHLGLSFDKGLSDYLLGNATLDEIIYSPDIDRFSVIPNAPGNLSSELLNSPRMDELMSSLQKELPPHIIVYDLPPLLVSDDVLSIAPRIDGMLLVVSQGVTDRKALESAREILNEMNLVGVVLNRSSENEEHLYGYDYLQD